MSRNIAVSDDVYEQLKREKKDKSFSELLRSKLNTEGKVSEVSGGKIISREVLEEVKEDISELTEIEGTET